MFNSPLPSASELPSSRQLIRSTAIAFAVAMGLLVTVVMPSEYAVDPTGLGRAMGLTQMGEIKISSPKKPWPMRPLRKPLPAPAIPAPVPEAAPARLHKLQRCSLPSKQCSQRQKPIRSV
jgi:hypothetical protein